MSGEHELKGSRSRNALGCVEARDLADLHITAWCQRELSYPTLQALRLAGVQSLIRREKLGWPRSNHGPINPARLLKVEGLAQIFAGHHLRPAPSAHGEALVSEPRSSAWVMAGYLEPQSLM